MGGLFLSSSPLLLFTFFLFFFVFLFIVLFFATYFTFTMFKSCLSRMRAKRGKSDHDNSNHHNREKEEQVDAIDSTMNRQPKDQCQCPEPVLEPGFPRWWKKVEPPAPPKSPTKKAEPPKEPKKNRIQLKCRGANHILDGP